MGKHEGLLWNLKGDLSAGLTVFLIAVPLCLGIAQASGAPLYSGIVAGMVGGIIIGFFSNSNLSVSGPAAGLTAIVADAIFTLGAFQIFLCAVMVAGLVQLLLGFVKAGTIADYFPTNVIEGMLAAIGVVIIIKQLPEAFGYTPRGNANMEDADDGFVFNSLFEAVNHVEPAAIIISIVGISLMLLWQKSKKLSSIKLLPAGLIVVVVGTLINELLKNGGSAIALNQSHLVNLPVARNANDFVNQFMLPDFSAFANPLVWQAGVVIAIVASIETLLCIEATDKMDPLKRYTNTNRELKAQGIGNIFSGLLGGLPMTSVIVRSSANINAGARTKTSTIFHGVLLLVCAALIPILLNKIPKAALAAILIMTGYRLCRPAVFKHMWAAGKTQFIPFAATVIAVVATDLLKGVVLGLLISIFYILRQNSRTPYFFNKKEYKEGSIIKLELAQEVSFLNKASIKRTLDHLPENSSVVIDASDSIYIDHDVLETIREFKDVKAEEMGISLTLTGFQPDTGIENTEKSEDEDFASYEEFVDNYLKISKSKSTI